MITICLIIEQIIYKVIMWLGDVRKFKRKRLRQNMVSGHKPIDRFSITDNLFYPGEIG